MGSRLIIVALDLPMAGPTTPVGAPPRSISLIEWTTRPDGTRLIGSDAAFAPALLHAAGRAQSRRGALGLASRTHSLRLGSLIFAAFTLVELKIASCQRGAKVLEVSHRRDQRLRIVPWLTLTKVVPSSALVTRSRRIRREAKIGVPGSRSSCDFVRDPGRSSTGHQSNLNRERRRLHTCREWQGLRVRYQRLRDHRRPMGDSKHYRPRRQHAWCLGLWSRSEFCPEPSEHPYERQGAGDLAEWSDRAVHHQPGQHRFARDRST